MVESVSKKNHRSLTKHKYTAAKRHWRMLIDVIAFLLQAIIADERK